MRWSACRRCSNYCCSRSSVDIGFLSRGQSTVTRHQHDRQSATTYRHIPKIRLPGAGGRTGRSRVSPEVIVVVRHRDVVRRPGRLRDRVGCCTGPVDRARLGLRGAGPCDGDHRSLGIRPPPDPETCCFDAVSAFIPGSPSEPVRDANRLASCRRRWPRNYLAPTDEELAVRRELRADERAGAMTDHRDRGAGRRPIWRPCTYCAGGFPVPPQFPRGWLRPTRPFEPGLRLPGNARSSTTPTADRVTGPLLRYSDRVTDSYGDLTRQSRRLAAGPAIVVHAVGSTATSTLPHTPLVEILCSERVRAVTSDSYGRLAATRSTTSPGGGRVVNTAPTGRTSPRRIRPVRTRGAITLHALRPAHITFPVRSGRSTHRARDSDVFPWRPAAALRPLYQSTAAGRPRERLISPSTGNRRGRTGRLCFSAFDIVAARPGRHADGRSRTMT